MVLGSICLYRVLSVTHIGKSGHVSTKAKLQPCLLEMNSFWEAKVDIFSCSNWGGGRAGVAYIFDGFQLTSSGVSTQRNGWLLKLFGDKRGNP